jgi:serine/threonine-protein kinase
VDFGLAVGGDRGSPNARTVDYAGLEKLTGVDKDDPRSDVYFAGCMYYHLLTGKPPLTESRDRFQRMNISRFREVVPLRSLLPDVPSVVEVIVEKAMSLTVSDRYPRPVDMLVDLNKAREAIEAAARQGDLSGSSLSLASQRSRCVLVLESHDTIQNALRIALKKQGYHVILMEDPDRAWQRILDAPTSIGCAIIATGRLGAAALQLYKKLRTYPVTQKIPTVLLLGRSHAIWQQKLRLLDELQRVFPVADAKAGLASAASDRPS